MTCCQMREVRLPASEKSCVIHKCYPGTFHYVRVYCVGVDDTLIARSCRLTVQISAPPEPPSVSLRYYNAPLCHWSCSGTCSSIKHYKKSAHLTTVERCTQLINLWLTAAMYSVFDRVTAETDTCMTTTAEHCIEAIGLDAYRHERSCNDLISLPLPARCYVSFTCIIA